MKRFMKQREQAETESVSEPDNPLGTESCRKITKFLKSICLSQKFYIKPCS